MAPESDVTPELSKELDERFEQETVTAEEAKRRLEALDPLEKIRLFELRRQILKLIRKAPAFQPNRTLPEPPAEC